MNEPTEMYDPGSAGDDELLNAFVGPQNDHYYAAAFNIFAAGSNVRWNWPAFFVTFPWLLYRKMWLYALGYVIGIPVALAIIFSTGGMGGGESLLYFIISWVLAPMFCTRLYYAHARSKIGNIKLRTSSVEEQRLEVARAGSTSVVGIVIAILIVPGVGIIAAISIPAYQDYTVRAQISEGLNLSTGAKAAVTEYYFDNNQLPPDNATAGLVPATEIYGKYVSSVQVTAGEVVVTYGNDSNQVIRGHVLVLRPQISDQRVAWVCSSPSIAPKHLPAACR